MTNKNLYYINEINNKIVHWIPLSSIEELELKENRNGKVNEFILSLTYCLKTKKYYNQLNEQDIFEAKFNERHNFEVFYFFISSKIEF